MAVLNNSSQAVIESDAEVTGTEGVEVASEITYPRRDSIPGSNGGGWDEAYGIIKSLALNPTVNAVESWFFNTSTNVGIKGVGSEDSKRLNWILTGSVIVEDITNRNLAQIADGAQINQSTSDFAWYDAATETTLQTADLGELEETNGVSIEAKSDITQWGIAGQLYIGLDLLTFGTTDIANNLLPFQKSSRNAFGGSANFVIISEQTQALLGGVDPDGNTPQNASTNVTYGSGEEEVGLSVQAETVTELLEISQSAASSSGFGIEASTTYLLMGENEENDADRGQFTYAELNSENLPIELTPISGTAGEVVVEAADSSDLWAISGAVMLGATKGIGVSASVIELNRDAAAGVGTRTAGGTPKSTNRKQTAGDFTIDASMDGTIMPMALVGAISASRDSSIGGSGEDKVPAEGGTGGASSIEGKWGLGISGDFSGAFVDDQAQAYLNSSGTISGIESEGTELSVLEIAAKNETIMNPIGGQATISIARGKSGAMAGITGSASVAEYQSHVTAMLENATIEYLGIDLQALNEKRIGTCAAGLQVQAPKGADLQIAGSVVVNEITNTTIASITDVIQTEGLGEVSLSALQLDEIWGGAGTAAVTYDRRSDQPKAKTAVGVGMSAVWNQIDNTTTAEVVDSTLHQSEGLFDVVAEDFTSSRVLSAGVNVTVPAGIAIEIGGMWATNYVSPRTTAQITGSTIENAATDDPMSVVAVLAPYLDSFAGYFSLEFGKPLSTKETQLGVGVGAAVVVTRLGPKDSDGTALPTLAQVSNSTLNRGGDLTVRAFTGALDDQTSSFVPNQDLAESQVGELSLHALAIAGSAQGENSADSEFSAGIVVNGAVVVTDLKIDTQATITTNSSINEEASVNDATSMVEVLATNQLSVSTDAGGASVSESVTLTGSSVDIAVGGADNSFNSSNETSATIANNSSVVAESLDIIASHAPEIDNIAFGVAVSVALSTSMFGAAAGFSGAFLQADQADAVLAGISDSDVDLRRTITVQADDQSKLTTGSGAGSLQVSYGSGAAVSLAPSAVTNKVTVGNLVLAWIGEQPLANGTLVDTSVTADSSSVSAVGGITVAATCDQEIANEAIAVAVSVSIAPDFASAAGAGSGASSTITTNNIIKSAVNGVSDLTVGGSIGMSVTAADSGSNNITVGTAAASLGWFGASIGISLAEIVNNDQIVAEVQNSTIQTNGNNTTGAPVEITATDTVQLTTDAVATSLSISIGASGAGGKSNITSNAQVAASLGDGSTVTALTGEVPGDLTVKAESSEELLAEIFGGTAGLGAVGVFNSDAKHAGSTAASLNTAGAIDVNDLSVIASADQSVISQGMSVTVGGLAGTGENHNVTVSESVTTIFQGQNQQWNIDGNLLVTSSSTNNATARTSGSGGQGEDVSASLMGVGFFKVNSDVSPNVSLQVSDVLLDVQGTATFDVNATNQNNTESKSGSGSLVGGDAAKATTTNSPNVGLTIEKMNLTSSGSTTISGSIETSYSTNANSVYATAIGGSAARSYNTSEPVLKLTIGSEDATEPDTTIQASGTVDVSASNTLLGIGDGNSKNAAGFMARVGAGGGISEFGGTANSTTTGTSSIEVNDYVSIRATEKGNIQVSSTNDWQSTQLTHLGTGGVINGAGVQSILDSTLNNTITLGSDVKMIAPQGEIGIGTRNYSATTSNADSYTFGLAGGSNSDSSNKMNSTQTVEIGSNSKLYAGRDIVVTAGYNPVKQQGSLMDVYAVVTARCAGLLESPTTTADATATANSTVNIGSDASIISHADVELGSIPGINNASWYTFANIDGAKGKVHQGSDGLTESNSVTIDGDVTAGNTNQLTIEIPVAGKLISVNGSDDQNIPSEQTTLTPDQVFPVTDTSSTETDTSATEADAAFTKAGAFLPFTVSYDSSYDATQLLDGLDETSKAILESSISKKAVTAITLTELAAVGGQVVLHATDLQGNAHITANLPSISITNQSNAYLLLDGVGNANTLNMGQVTIVGGAAMPSSMTFTEDDGVPSIVVLQSYGQPVGDSASGPAIAVNDTILNTAGSVQITNDKGALVQIAAINAQTVSISTPNSAYIVSTPADYYGSSGEIKDYWTAGTQLVQDGYFESPLTGSYVYNPTGTAWDFNGSTGVSANNSGFTSGNPDAPQGKQVAFIQGTGELSQAIASMTGGESYVMQFDAAQRANYPDQTIVIALDGQELCTITPSSNAYETYACSVYAPAKELPSDDSLRLTDGAVSTATAFWHQDQVEFPTSGSMTIDFTYQAGGNKAADGITLAFQNEGVNAIGGTGDALGYVGITSPTAAYEINLYRDYVQGSNFVTTNSSGNYLSTSPVSFNSGNPIEVQLVYDVDANTVTEKLTDTTTNDTFTRIYDNIDLSSVLGAEAYIGFTGGDGGATSTQTVTDFSLTISESSPTPLIQGFGNWDINVSRLLTVTGLEPSGVDETVFLDNLVLSTNPAGFVPGLNSYVTDYTASLAATTAANVLYLGESGKSSSSDFSSWLYNTGDHSINVNTNVSPGNYGDNYPKKAGDNYGSSQQGSGIIFFGSEIPYLWTGATSNISGSNYLTDDLGYADTLANAQTYSVNASGNPSDSNLNVTQGTGPQNDNVSPGRGVFPVVPAYFPTSVSVSSPESRSLGGSGITAGSLDVTALYLDINGPINVGAVNQAINIVLGSDLQQQLDDYQQSYQDGSESSATLDLDPYFGTSGMTGYFDAAAGQIVLDPFAINAGLAEAVFTGAIISTTDSGAINVHSDPGEVDIQNQTNYPLVLENISAANQKLSGTVVFNDTITNQSTAYIYSPDEEVRVYQGDLHAAIDDMNLVDSSSGDSGNFQPGSDQSYVEGSVSSSSMTYEWTTNAWISRELTFTGNDSGGYDLESPSTSDSWNWGRAASTSKEKTASSNPFPSVATVLLSDGQNNDANAFWHPETIDIPTNDSFTVTFTYQASGDKAADGITFAFQNEGANAVGETGGSLGYVGITGPTAAYQINLYDGEQRGSNFVTTNTAGNYLATGDVDFNSGNPIEVTLVYDAVTKTVKESLTDSTTSDIFSRTYQNIDLNSVLGSEAYIGFTGGDGGATSIQTASDFSMSGSTELNDFTLWNGLYHQKVIDLGETATGSGELQQSVTAVITQSESATTKFSGSSKDAWNYGPSTTWDWTYPTEILLQNRYQVPAANSISIDFSGVQYGSLDVDSDSELQLKGNIIFPGTVSLSANDNLTQVKTAIVAANQVDLKSNGGSIGTDDTPVHVSIDPSSSINATASSGIYLASDGDLVVGQIVTSTGQVELEAAGDFSAGSSGAMVAGDNLSLQTANGDIGTQAEPLTIQTKTSQLESGTVTDGLLTAAAEDGIYLVQPEGDLRLLSVTTSSSLGVVSIANQGGNITDGNTSDIFKLNQLTRKDAVDLIKQIKNVQQNTADFTITAFEASVDQNYLQYWTLLPSRGSYDQQSDTFVLNADGVAYYQPQADLFYTDQSGSETQVTATEAQVQQYGNSLYQNSVNVFQDDLVFSADWASLPQFQSYDSEYTFTASEVVVDELTYGATDLSNSFAMLSLAALSPKGTAVIGPMSPAIQTTFLDLNSAGSIGLPFHVIEVDYAKLQQGTLTSQEKAILTQATAAGELQIIGVNSAGQRVAYSSGSRPEDVTPVAVLVRIDKPIFVDLAENGLVQLQAGDSINLTESMGDLNVLYAETPYTVKLVSQVNVLNAPLNDSASTFGWSSDENGVLGYTDTDLVYTATNFTLGSPVFSTGMIENGSFEEPVQSAGGFTYAPVSTNWTFSPQAGISDNGSGFTQGNPNAPIGNQVAFIQEQGVISQEIDGLVAGQTYSLEFDIAQRSGYPAPTFTVDLDGQLLTTQTPTSTNYETVTVPFVFDTTSLELTDGQSSEANAYWYQSPLAITETGQFTVEFTYEASGDAAADGITFAFQKEGTNALGATGGSLGYVGITGPTAAYQINLYDGHQRGSNFVTTNTSETYLPTDLVSFNSGNPIKVQLVFDAEQKTVTETLTDSVQQTSFSRTYDEIDLASLMEGISYIGFTGGDGGATSAQTVTDFKLFRKGQSDSPVISGFGGWDFTGQHTLTFTGLDATSVDQTVFLDDVKITRSPGVVSSDLRLVAGGSIGTNSFPLNAQVGGRLDAFATNDLYLTHPSSSNLRLNAIYAGGDATIDAPNANIFAVENFFKGSVANFGTDGSGNGWSNESVQGAVAFADDALTLQNDAAPAGATETWYSRAATQLDTSVTIENRFISSFVYQNDGSDSNLGFVLASIDTDVSTLAQTDETSIPNTFALRIQNQCEGCSTSQAISASYDGELKTTPVPDEIGLSSGDPIEVLMIYESLTRTASVTLTNAGNSFTFDLPGLDLLKVLGTNQARVGFVAQGSGQASTQEITGFSFAYGAPSIETNQLTVTSGLQIGASQTPILILALGGVQAAAPNGVYLTQISGDLLINSATSSGSVQLSAPAGSILTSDESSNADALIILTSENLASQSDLPHVTADVLAVMGLKNIGELNNELQLQVSQLSAKTVLGDINLGQIGDLLIANPLRAGGAINLLGNSTITFDAPVIAEADVDFRTEGDSGVLHFLAGAHLLSNQGAIQLHADRTLTTEIGAILESSTGVSLSGGTAPLGSEETHRMQLLGLIRGGPLQMTSAADDDSLQVAIADWTGIDGNPLEAVLNDFSMLHLDDSHSSLGKNYVATNSRLESEVANLELGELQTLRMDLGSGSDSFRTEPSWQLNSLNINDAGGSNQYEFAGALGGLPKAIGLSGGSDLEQLLIDGNGTPIWLAEGIVHVGDFEIQHSDIEKLLVENELSVLRPEISNAVEIDHEAFPDNTLTLVGTAGNDDLFIDLGNPNVSLIGLWNETNDLRRDFESMDFDALRFILLDGDDSLLVDGNATLPLFVEGGQGGDWIQIDSNSDTSVIDLSGNNIIKTSSGSDTIRTGAGRDRIDAGNGSNEVHDSGGVNWIFAGSQNDQIYHANDNDWIAAGQGINDVWLNGSLVNWHNQSLRSDINRDLRVSALDALTLINELQKVGVVNLEGSPNSTDDLYDASDDGRLTAIDILVVINDLDRNLEAEGEYIGLPTPARYPAGDETLANDEVFSKWEDEFDEIGSTARYDINDLEGFAYQPDGESLSRSADPAVLRGVDELHGTLESMNRAKMMEELEDHFLALKIGE
ncbi:MAG: dockerin type I domain-containing protein [Rubripirellula sp.]|nr:dockerin type I domain-containing protein [Rubripirellula sp.]